MATESNKYIVKRFDSIDSFERYLSTNQTQPAFVRHEHGILGDDSFTGTKSYEEANNLLLYGDRELAKRIEEEGVGKTRVSLMAKAQQIKTEANVVGFMPHVPNFIAGVPLTMISARRMERRARSLSIIYNMSVSCIVKTEDIIKASATVLAAIMKIEASGTRCNIYAGAHFASKPKASEGQNVAAFVRLKSSDKKLDVVRCAYMFAHSSAFRRHLFRFVEVTEGVDRSMVDGYGCVVRSSDDVKDAIKKSGTKIEDSVVLSYYEVQGKSIDEVVKLIQEQASKKGR